MAIAENDGCIDWQGSLSCVCWVDMVHDFVADTICIWHCFLVDKGSDRYASPETGRAEGECLYRRHVPIWAFIDQKAVPYAFYRTTTHMFNW